MIGTVKTPAGMSHKKGADKWGAGKKGCTKIVCTVGLTDSAV
ncbi:hypothetical protein ABZ379_27320 [Streptomyces canus]